MPGWLGAMGAVWLVLALTFPTLPGALQASIWRSAEDSQPEREEDPLPEVQDIPHEAPRRSLRIWESAARRRPADLIVRSLNRAAERPAASALARQNGVGKVLRC
jgi:hypothetical protein